MDSSDIPQSFGEAQSIVQYLLNRQLQIQAAKLSAVASSGAETIRELGDVLQKRRSSKAANDLVEELASKTDDVATYLKSTSGTKLFSDIQGYGVAKPVVASMLAVGAGFIAARLMKVSAIGARFAR